jgi:antitoxin component of MazEF toxin-antitoxin module
MATAAIQRQGGAAVVTMSPRILKALRVEATANEITSRVLTIIDPADA